MPMTPILFATEECLYYLSNNIDGFLHFRELWEGGQVIATLTEANSYCGCAERDPVVTFILPVRNYLLVCGEKPTRSEYHPVPGELFPKLHF